MQPLFDLFDLVFAADYALRQIIGSVRWMPLDGVMFLASYVNAWGFVWIVLGGIAAWARPSRARGVWQLVLAIVLASVVSNQVMKPLVDRDRPFKVPVAQTGVRSIGHRPASQSFPSGQAATAVAGAMALARVWPQSATFAWVLALLVSFSRIYLGLSYPLDVIGGMAVGRACSWFVVGRTSWTRPVRDEEPLGAAV